MSNPIFVVPYDTHWPEQFAALVGPLRAALGPAALRIDHIGSTSVPGLDAKPVIDIQLSVAAVEPMNSYLGQLEGVGYAWHPFNDDLTRRFFREPSGQQRTHLHVKSAGSWSEQMALLFRDYLRTHGAAAQRYAALKHQLAERFRDDRPAYTNAKAPLIWELLREADEWCRLTGWSPGPSDA